MSFQFYKPSYRLEERCNFFFSKNTWILLIDVHVIYHSGWLFMDTHYIICGHGDLISCHKFSYTGWITKARDGHCTHYIYSFLWCTSLGGHSVDIIGCIWWFVFRQNVCSILQVWLVFFLALRTDRPLPWLSSLAVYVHQTYSNSVFTKRLQSFVECVYGVGSHIMQTR